MPSGEIDWSGPAPCPVPVIEWQTTTNPATIPMELMWPLDLTCCSVLEAQRDSNGVLSPAVQQLALQAQAAASQALFDLTCRQYKVCRTTIWPCIECGCADVCTTSCNYSRYDLTRLVGSDILEIDEVRVGGVAIPEADYRLDSRRWLVPINTGLLHPWPVQDLTAADNSPRTWGVSVYYGELPPALLLLAAQDMACNLVARCLDQPCDIPENAVSVTREGVTIRLETGMKAIPTVKMALEVYGDCKKRRRSSILDPAHWPTGRSS